MRKIIKAKYFPLFPSKVKIVTVEKKVNEILNRLEKTKLEKFPDLAAEKEGRDREERNEKKAQIQEMKRKEKEEMKKKREMDELRYAGEEALLFTWVLPTGSEDNAPVAGGHIQVKSID